METEMDKWTEEAARLLDEFASMFNSSNRPVDYDQFQDAVAAALAKAAEDATAATTLQLASMKVTAQILENERNELRAEVERLTHDINRHLDICTSLEAERDAAVVQGLEIAAKLDCIYCADGWPLKQIGDTVYHFHASGDGICRAKMILTEIAKRKKNT